MMVHVTARVSDVNISDADGLPVTNGSTIPLYGSLICSTPYDLNFTFSWTNVYNSSQVVAGNTLILSEVGSFDYRCTIDTFPVFQNRCSTSRTVRGSVSSLGTI